MEKYYKDRKIKECHSSKKGETESGFRLCGDCGVTWDRGRACYCTGFEHGKMYCKYCGKRITPFEVEESDEEYHSWCYLKEFASVYKNCVICEKVITPYEQEIIYDNDGSFYHSSCEDFQEKKSMSCVICHKPLTPFDKETHFYYKRGKVHYRCDTFANGVTKCSQCGFIATPTNSTHPREFPNESPCCPNCDNPL
jgi:hypothetical protein